MAEKGLENRKILMLMSPFTSGSNRYSTTKFHWANFSKKQKLRTHNKITKTQIQGEQVNGTINLKKKFYWFEKVTVISNLVNLKVIASLLWKTHWCKFVFKAKPRLPLSWDLIFKISNFYNCSILELFSKKNLLRLDQF